MLDLAGRLGQVRDHSLAHSQALLARCRTWVDSHADQAIIVGSLIIGFWFIADSLYLIVS